MNPPLKLLWNFNDRVLIEFPPVIVDGVGFVADKYGDLRAIRLSDRKVLWDLRHDHPHVGGAPSDVTGPTYAGGRVFVAFENGILLSIDAKTGKPIWKRDFHTHLESSPLVVGGTLYIGSDKTNLFALRIDDGRVRWQYNASSAIKASPSYHRGRLYVGNYSGSMICLDARSGRLIWRNDTTQHPPYGDGGFYSSPAISHGRVYAGRDDGVVFAFDQRTGRLAWQYTTKGAIYGSPAVAEVPGTPLTVYIGSYDHYLYALSAKTGKVEWRFNVGGQVPGTSPVLGHTVYTSSFQTRKSIGIDVLTHRKTFSFPSPGYTPMISDGRDLYLIGYFSLQGLAPK